MGIERIQKTFEIQVRWRAFPLHPETPEQGRTLEDLFAGRGVDIPRMMDRLRQVAADQGLPFGDRHRTFNSRKAQELGKWAESLGRGDAFHDAAFAAYFVEGRNIADRAVLADVAASAGLSAAEVDAALANRAFADAVDEDWALAMRTGINAVPTLVLNQRLVSGFQPYANLAAWIASMGVQRRE